MTGAVPIGIGVAAGAAVVFFGIGRPAPPNGTGVAAFVMGADSAERVMLFSSTLRNVSSP